MEKNWNKMKRNSSIPYMCIQKIFALTIIVFLMNACAPRVSPGNHPTPDRSEAGSDISISELEVTEPATLTNTPTSPTATSTVQIAPTATQELVPAESVQPTVTVPKSPVLQHFQSGQELEIRWIMMLNDQEGWALATVPSGGDEHVLFTADGGITWTDRTPPQPAMESSLTALATFLDSEHGWVVYIPSDPLTSFDPAFVWRTRDGGQSWQVSTPLDRSGLDQSFFPSQFQFVDLLHGWLLVHVGVGMNHDYVVLYHSIDGGLSWERIQDPFIDDSSIQACLKTGMTFTDLEHGWLTGDCNGVAVGALLFMTEDSGRSWMPIALPEPVPGVFSESGPACGTYSPVFLNPQEGFLVVRCVQYLEDSTETNYFGYATIDGGETWRIETYPGGDLYILDNQVRWAMGRDQYQTTDGAINWEKIAEVSWDGQFSFISQMMGWSAARSEKDFALYTTENGGRDWQLLKPVAK